MAISVQIASPYQYASPGKGANVVTRTSGGTLYTAIAGAGISTLADCPITVYKSTDSGYN